MRNLNLSASLMAFGFILGAARAQAADGQKFIYRAGAAQVVITPSESMWASGYGSRTAPVSEKVHDLYAKALVLEDKDGYRVVIVTTDLLGLPRGISEPLAARIARDLKIDRAQILLNSSHTHCGPVLRESLVDIYPMKDSDWDAVGRYSTVLQERLVEVVQQAAGHMQPVTLATAVGRSTFAINRRENPEKNIVPGYQPRGLVDHDVPVLCVSDGQGKPMAILFAYACHNTTMSFYKWCGDYAGFAQLDLKKKYPGAIAMFAQGCGGDANPLPRRALALCEKYGRQLAGAVETAMNQPMSSVTGPLVACYEEIDLPLAGVPDRKQLEAETAAREPARQAFTRRLLKALDAGQAPQTSYRHYPVQAIQVGDQATIVALGGEVVVDYSLRLKKELGPASTWILGYSNDVMAYIPSRRVLAEGGYEGATSMYVYGLPGVWSPQVEDLIVAAAHRCVDQIRAATRPAG